MRQSVQFPMLVKSENLIRGRNKFAIYGDHEAQRQRFTLPDDAYRQAARHRFGRDEPLRDYALPDLRWVPRFRGIT